MKCKIVFEVSETTENDATSVQKAIQTLLDKIRLMPWLEMQKTCVVKQLGDHHDAK